MSVAGALTRRAGWPRQILPRSCVLYALLGMGICVLSACQSPGNLGPTRVPLEPGSSMYHPEPSQAISPDGKYVAATEINSQSVRLVAIPLDSRTEGVVLRPTAGTWTDRSKLDYRPLGWFQPRGSCTLPRGCRIRARTRPSRESSLRLLMSGRGPLRSWGLSPYRKEGCLGPITAQPKRRCISGFSPFVPESE